MEGERIGGLQGRTQLPLQDERVSVTATHRTLRAFDEPQTHTPHLDPLAWLRLSQRRRIPLSVASSLNVARIVKPLVEIVICRLHRDKLVFERAEYCLGRLTDLVVRRNLLCENLVRYGFRVKRGMDWTV